MSDRILIPLMDGRWLALDRETFQKGLLSGSDLVQREQPKLQDDQKPIWLSVPEVARLCNISETYLYDEIRLNHIHSRRLGRAVRIHRDFVEHQTGDLISNGDDDE